MIYGLFFFFLISHFFYFLEKTEDFFFSSGENGLSYRGEDLVIVRKNGLSY